METARGGRKGGRNVRETGRNEGEESGGTKRGCGGREAAEKDVK